MLARIFYKPDYQSDATQFIGQLKAERPQLEAEQRAGRALLWDKPVDRAAAQAFADAKVPQNAYVYHVKT